MKKKYDYDPYVRSQTLEVVLTETMVLEFLSSQQTEDETKMITDISLFDFRKYVQKKRNDLPKVLFEKE